MAVFIRLIDHTGQHLHRLINRLTMPGGERRANLTYVDRTLLKAVPGR
jgi:hypothetical protein